MSEEEQDSTKQGNSDLYHKQAPVVGQRRTSNNASASRGKPPRMERPGNKYIRQNARILFFSFFTMLLLMGLAAFMAHTSWRLKEKRHERELEALRLEEEEAIRKREKALQGIFPAPDEAASTPSEEEEEERGVVRKENIDTDSITKAVYQVKRGDGMREAGNLEGAVEAYIQALSIWPYLETAWKSLGKTYIGLGQYSKAQLALKKYINRFPSDVDAMNDLGLTYLKGKDLETAKHLFETASEIEPEFPKTYYHLAVCHIGLKDFDAADQSLDTFLKLEPNDPDGLKEKAFIAARRNRFDIALDYLRTAISEAPDRPALYFDAAATSALMGRVDDAIRYLERAEAFTDPGQAYRAFQQPAFRIVQRSEAGKLYKEALAERARKMIQSAN